MKCLPDSTAASSLGLAKEVALTVSARSAIARRGYVGAAAGDERSMLIADELLVHMTRMFS